MQHLSLLIVLLVAVAIGEDTPTKLHLRQAGIPTSGVLRIGTTHISYGPLVGWGKLLINTWKLFLARAPTYLINGTVYSVELISYLDDMDPADGNTTVALVERLVLHDKVNVLMTPYEGNTMPDFIFKAEQLGIPCINVGAFAFSFYPPSSFSWTVNIMPSLATLGLQCAVPLYRAGARTFVYIARTTSWETPSAASLELLVLNACELGGLTRIGPILNVTQKQLDEPSLLDTIFEQLATIDADLIVFEFDQVGNVVFIEQMRRNNYNPRAYLAWGTGSYPEVRIPLGWKAGFGLISEAYSPYLNNLDPFWGSTTQYDALYQANFNSSSAFADANLAAGLSLLNAALLCSQDTSPVAIRTALLSLDMDTVVGRISFTNGTLNRPLYCFQNSENSSAILTVWPDDSEVPSYQDIIYPAVVMYPSDYFDQFKRNRNMTLAKVLGGTFGAFGLLLILGIALLLFYKFKYHLVLIPKGARKTDTWASS